MQNLLRWFTWSKCVSPVDDFYGQVERDGQIVRGVEGEKEDQGGKCWDTIFVGREMGIGNRELNFSRENLMQEIIHSAAHN